jgi:hypothetical protein
MLSGCEVAWFVAAISKNDIQWNGGYEWPYYEEDDCVYVAEDIREDSGKYATINKYQIDDIKRLYDLYANPKWDGYFDDLFKADEEGKIRDEDDDAEDMEDDFYEDVAQLRSEK